MFFLADFCQRLLDHLKEAAFFTGKDLESVGQRLDGMQETLERGKQTYSPHLLTLLGNRLETCRGILAELRTTLADLSPELTPTHERLVSILRSISAANTRSKVCSRVVRLGQHASNLALQFPASEVESFREQLDEIKGTMIEGKFIGADGTAPAGQEIVAGLLEKCLLWSEIVLDR